MFFSSPEWSRVSLRLESPCPLRTAECAESDDDNWNLWKNMRLKLEKNTIHIYPICQLWFQIIRNLPNISKPFLASWAVTSPAQMNQTFDISVTCTKWETLCLLSKVILINLEQFLQSPGDEGNRYRLRDATACAQRATVELNEWRADGHLGTWSNEVVPLEVDFGYFKALEELSALLFQLFVLSLTQNDDVLMHTSLLSGIITRLGLLCEEDSVPEVLIPGLVSIYKAVDIGISTEVVRAALSMAKTGIQDITWMEVIYWQKRIIACHPPGLLYKSEALKNAERDLLVVIRIAGAIEVEEPETPPAKSLMFELKYPFPFDIKGSAL